MDDIERKMSLPDVKIMDKILSEQDRIIWESMGLTPDVQSMENATLLTKVSFRNLQDIARCSFTTLFLFLSVFHLL